MTDSSKTQNRLLWLLILLGLTLLMRGWVFAKLWGWFVAPAFTLPPLKLSTSVGLMIVATFLRSSPDEDERPVGYMVMMTVSACLVALFLGWAVYQVAR